MSKGGALLKNSRCLGEKPRVCIGPAFQNVSAPSSHVASVEGVSDGAPFSWANWWPCEVRGQPARGMDVEQGARAVAPGPAAAGFRSPEAGCSVLAAVPGSTPACAASPELLEEGSCCCQAFHVPPGRASAWLRALQMLPAGE